VPGENLFLLKKGRGGKAGKSHSGGEKDHRDGPVESPGNPRFMIEAGKGPGSTPGRLHTKSEEMVIYIQRKKKRRSVGRGVLRRREGATP